MTWVHNQVYTLVCVHRDENRVGVLRWVIKYDLMCVLMSVFKCIFNAWVMGVLMKALQHGYNDDN